LVFEHRRRNGARLDTYFAEKHRSLIFIGCKSR
jgi:hypothetical protein